MDDDTYIQRGLVRQINNISDGVPEFSPFPLNKSFLLPSPLLDHLICPICQCVPSKPIELLTCRHYLCTACIIGQSSCPCNNSTLSPDDLCAPSQLILDIIGRLLLRCNKSCGQIVEIQHLRTHLQSDCTETEIPPPSDVSIEQLLLKDPDMPLSLMETSIIGLLVEKLIPISGPLTCRSSIGKVYKYNNHSEI